MSWFPKSLWGARCNNDAVYAPPPKDAILSFIANHNGSAGRQGIIEYMAEMYDMSEYAARNHLSELTQRGELAHEGDSYQVPDEPVADDGLSDWG